MKTTLERFLYRLENHEDITEKEGVIFSTVTDAVRIEETMNVLAHHLRRAMQGNPATKEDLEYIHRDLVKEQEQENFKRDVKELIEFIDSFNIPWASEFEAKVDNVRKHLQ